jgi:hypothetical protein
MENKIIKVTDLHIIGGGLNIEGGDPYKILKDNNNHNILWINTILVLDRPLVDNIIFEDLFNDTTYPILENRINEINEHHYMAVYLTILQYYIKNGKRLLGKKEDDTLKITVHFHQDVTCQPLIQQVVSHLNSIMKIPVKIAIDYLTDKPIFSQTAQSYKGTEILLSFSQCAGLEPLWKPGVILISDTFVPFSIDDSIVKITDEYKVVNDIMTRLLLILESEYNKKSVEYVNKFYKSYNPNKNVYEAKILTLDDFNVTKILQVDKLWNPTDKEEIVRLVECPNC